MIKLLSSDVVNKIAAGEVVERPSSVLKELIENSIDAGASEIHVYIEEFGTKKIQVIDNGSGVAESDLENVFVKHATSKITGIHDLLNIASYGFRGEALASISSVSEIQFSTHNLSDVDGIEVVARDGKIISKRPSPLLRGTDISVLNLFGNIPARKKFLKAPATETKALVDIFNAFALVNPQVSFFLHYQGTEKSFLAAEQKIRISQVLKIKPELLIPVQYDGQVHVSGYVIHPAHPLKSKQLQFLFVNSRLITDKTVQKGVLDGYDTFLMKHQYPGYILFLSLPGTEVDINVHPRKTEVRFSNPQEVYKSVKYGVKVNLTNHIRSETMAKIQSVSVPEMSAVIRDEDIVYEKEPEQEIKVTSAKSNYEEFEKFLHAKHTDTFQKNSRSSTGDAMLFSEHIIKTDDAPKLQLDLDHATQLLQSYIVTSNNQGIVLIDQHAASERYFYEKYLKSLQDRNVVSKVLLFPIDIHMQDSEVRILAQNQEVFESLGFKMEEFGNNEMRITHTPEFVKLDSFENVFHRILSDILEHEEITSVKEKIFHEVAAILACHTAVRFGDSLNKVEIIKILKDLSMCEDPYNCPHGRPIIQEWEKYEIEKKFKRCGL